MQNSNKQNAETADSVSTQPPYETITNADQSDYQKQFPEEYADISDSVMTQGDHVVFFIRNGEWANEIGAEETANNFSYYATDVMDSLDAKKINNSFLIGDHIKIGLQDGSVFKIKQEDCVMGIVLITPGKAPLLECGVTSTTDFWNYFNQYYKP